MRSITTRFSYRRVATSVAAACLCLGLAACAEGRFSDSELVTASRAVSVDPGRAVVVLGPGSLPTTGVTQRTYDNGISQVISLRTRGRTPGENTIHAALVTAADLPDNEGVEGHLLRAPGIDDFTIAQEMEERLPGVPMAPSALFVQNKYGPFGYAFGRSAAGDACIYAWQRMASGDRIFLPRSGVASIRIRVCDPVASEAALLRLAYDYSLNASLRRPGWNPIGDAPAPAPELGRAGAPIYPVPLTSFPAASERSQPVRPRPARAPRAEPERVSEPVPTRPLEGYPTVPPPPTP